MIVKIQRPLSTNDSIACALVYNKSQSIYILEPYTEEFEKRFFSDGRLKVYVRAKVVGKELKLFEEVEEPNW